MERTDGLTDGLKGSVVDSERGGGSKLGGDGTLSPKPTRPKQKNKDKKDIFWSTGGGGDGVVATCFEFGIANGQVAR
jgi:hypothetical protein